MEKASRHAKRNITTKDKCLCHYCLPLLPTTITHWAWMCHLTFLLLRHLLSCSTCYHHQRPFELLLNRTLLQGTAYIVFRMTRHIYEYVCSYIPDSQKEKGDPTICLAAWRPEKQAQQLNRSIWKPSSLDNLLLNSDTSFLYTGRPAKHGGTPDSILDGWDMVEHEILPPPPSQIEDVAQWERAHSYPHNGAKNK